MTVYLPSLVPAPKAGQQDCFLSYDTESLKYDWKEASESDLFLGPDGKLHKGCTTMKFPKGSGGWDYMVLGEPPVLAVSNVDSVVGFTGYYTHTLTVTITGDYVKGSVLRIVPSSYGSYINYEIADSSMYSTATKTADYAYEAILSEKAYGSSFSIFISTNRLATDVNVAFSAVIQTKYGDSNTCDFSYKWAGPIKMSTSPTSITLVKGKSGTPSSATVSCTVTNNSSLNAVLTIPSHAGSPGQETATTLTPSCAYARDDNTKMTLSGTYTSGVITININPGVTTFNVTIARNFSVNALSTTMYLKFIAGTSKNDTTYTMGNTYQFVQIVIS